VNRNIEIKARVSDFEALRTIVEKLSNTPVQILHQRDIFFRCPNGRLKLRCFPEGGGELIFYQRANQTDAKTSNYLIYPTYNPDPLAETIAKSNGLIGEVVKERYLYMIGQTRIHLDKVEQLGEFLELEVVLREYQTEEEGIAIANTVMDQLHIYPEDLIAKSYFDLLYP
jgi:predicted adenylyl cyclase CyaB